jgi:plasmid stabilization system protein ParE
MKVEFCNLTTFKLEKLLEYLEFEWSLRTKANFREELDDRIQSIKASPRICASSSLDPRLRKCVVPPQTSIIYEIQGETIFVMNLIDNRQDPEKIKDEIENRFSS